jgi:hypothetical protein
MTAKHWTPAKKYLEYRPEPTSLRARNRPEIWCRVAWNTRSTTFRDGLQEGGSAGLMKSESRIGRQTGSQRLDREVSSARRALPPSVRAHEEGFASGSTR